MNWMLWILIVVGGIVYFARRGRNSVSPSTPADASRAGEREVGSGGTGVRPSFAKTWDAGGRSWNNPVAAMSRESGMFPTTPGGLETLLELESWINSNDDRAPGQMRACLEGDDPGVCHYVAMWCSNLGMRECEPALIALLGKREDVWGYARKQSALALAKLGCTGAVDALRKARMAEDSEGVADSMTEALRTLEAIGVASPLPRP